MKIDAYKWLRILAIAAVGAFNVEILSGWSTIEGLVPWGLLLYGLHLALIEDLTVRFRLNYKKLFLLGAIFGMVMESFLVKSTFAVEFPHDPAWRAFGINFDVLRDVSFFFGHGLLTVLLAFMIVDVLLPRRTEKPPLSRWHYVAFIACLLLFYISGFFGGEWSMPALGSVLLMLAIIAFFVGLLVWWVRRGEVEMQRAAEKSRAASVVTILLALVAGLVAFFTQLTNWLGAPLLAWIADAVGARRRALISIILLASLFQCGFGYGPELLAIGVAGVSGAGALGGAIQVALLLVAMVKVGGPWTEKADTRIWWRVPRYLLSATAQIVVALGLLLSLIFLSSIHITPETATPLRPAGLAYAALGAVLAVLWLLIVIREAVRKEMSQSSSANITAGSGNFDYYRREQ
jgi:phage-related holin